MIAEHPLIPAILTDRANGIAEFRRLTDAATKQSIASEAMADLARLHARPATGIVLDRGGQGTRITAHVRAEPAIWRAMYEETGLPDPLLDLAFRWLNDAVPDLNGPVALVHGDTGPGNFLFKHGRRTAITDWKLAHLGDPMEDLAWFSMHCVMELVPDFAATIATYEHAAGQAVDRARILHHRVLVSTRVVVIRHRDVTGDFGHAIVSRALNRRLLVEALSDASGVAIQWPPQIQAAATPRGAIFAAVLADLRDVIVPRSTDTQVIARANNAEDHQVPRSLRPARASDRGRCVVCRRGVPGMLQAFADAVAREAQFANGASGGIASRHVPAFPERLG